MKECPSCKKKLSFNASSCPSCGHVLKQSNSNPVLTAFIIFVIIVFIWEYVSSWFK